jgi:hypothetical protein
MNVFPFAFLLLHQLWIISGFRGSIIAIRYQGFEKGHYFAKKHDPKLFQATSTDSGITVGPSVRMSNPQQNSLNSTYGTFSSLVNVPWKDLSSQEIDDKFDYFIKSFALPSPEEILQILKQVHADYSILFHHKKVRIVIDLLVSKYLLLHFPSSSTSPVSSSDSSPSSTLSSSDSSSSAFGSGLLLSSFSKSSSSFSSKSSRSLTTPASAATVAAAPHPVPFSSQCFFRFLLWIKVLGFKYQRLREVEMSRFTLLVEQYLQEKAMENPRETGEALEVENKKEEGSIVETEEKTPEMISKWKDSDEYVTFFTFLAFVEFPLKDLSKDSLTVLLSGMIEMKDKITLINQVHLLMALMKIRLDIRSFSSEIQFAFYDFLKNCLTKLLECDEKTTNAISAGKQVCCSLLSHFLSLFFSL